MADDKTELELETEAQQLKRENELIDMRNLLATVSGRRFLWRFMSRFRAFTTPFVPGSPDVTAFNCGERNAASWLLTEVTSADPDAFARMQREAKDDAI